MKISKTMEITINRQMTNEFESAFLYLSMSTWFSNNNLPGFANWCYVQFLEEQEHAMKFHKYLLDRQGEPIIESVPKPRTSWNDPIELFQHVLDNEIKVTGQINEIYKQAKNEEDYATMSFLNWFLDEQVQEEEQSSDILNKLKLNNDSKSGLMFLDSELAKRKLG